MKFDIMGLVFMVVAIWVGNILGPMLGGVVGFGGGLIGAFISGIAIYLVYCLISGIKMDMFGAVMFAVAVYASVIVTGFATGYFGFISGIIAVFVQAIILSVIWSYIAPKKEVAKAPIKL